MADACSFTQDLARLAGDHVTVDVFGMGNLIADPFEEALSLRDLRLQPACEFRRLCGH